MIDYQASSRPTGQANLTGFTQDIADYVIVLPATTTLAVPANVRRRYLALQHIGPAGAPERLVLHFSLGGITMTAALCLYYGDPPFEMSEAKGNLFQGDIYANYDGAAVGGARLAALEGVS